MRAAEKILTRMRELARDPDSGWKVVPSDYAATLRFTTTIKTPDYFRGTGFGRWHEATYDQHVFVTLVAGKVILGVAAAPWVGRSDTSIPFWLAEAILDDPALGLDSAHRQQLKANRKAAGS
jgi:hypothetical protein